MEELGVLFNIFHVILTSMILKKVIINQCLLSTVLRKFSNTQIIKIWFSNPHVHSLWTWDIKIQQILVKYKILEILGISYITRDIPSPDRNFYYFTSCTARWWHLDSGQQAFPFRWSLMSKRSHVIRSHVIRAPKTPY